MFICAKIVFLLPILTTFICAAVQTNNNDEINNRTICSVCNCTSFAEYEFVDCSFRQLRDLPTNIPPNTANLGLQDNEIHIITDNDLPSLKYLRILNFTNNHVQSQFKLPLSLTHLYGRFNNLTNIFGMFNRSNHLKVINLEGNQISSIPKGTFASCHKLTTLYLSSNEIQHLSPGSFLGLNNLRRLNMCGIRHTSSIKADMFREIRQTIHTLRICITGLKEIEPGALNFSIIDLSFNTGNMHSFPGGIFAPLKGDIKFSNLDIMAGLSADEKLTDISPKTFDGVRKIIRLWLCGHNLKYLPEDLFRNTEFMAVQLNRNALEELPDGFLRSSPNLTFLSLYGNRLKCISNDTFNGLTSLQTLLLFRNQITHIPPLTFQNTNLAELFIFTNSISNLSKDALTTGNCTINKVHIYQNPLSVIEEGSFDCLSESGSKVYYSVDYLPEIPHFPSSVEMFGVGDNINTYFNMYHMSFVWLMERGMNMFGFQCNSTSCVPCKPGTYGDGIYMGCVSCPAGGYFQTRPAQISMEAGGIGCDLCTNGTFVSPERAPGARISDCQVCPAGTDKNKFAGLRACPCLDGYYRKDRFGPCMPCPAEGVICSNESQKVRPGYWWTWDQNLSNTTHVLEFAWNRSTTMYSEFVENLLTFNRSYNPASTRFEGTLPKPFRCPGGEEACPALNGINGSCGVGYEGWVCSTCSKGYYSWFEYCVKCPPIWHLILELLLVVILMCILVAIVSLDLKKKMKECEQHRDNTSLQRSLVYVLIARFKIVLGYYQIAGAIFISLHNIHWPKNVSNLAYVFKVLELNIFKLLAKPRCYIDKLQLNIYTEFLIGLVFCILVVIFPCIVFASKWLFLRFDKTLSAAEVKNKLHRFRGNCCLVVVVVLFISYLSLCDVILSLMPVACQEFCVDVDDYYCTERLRSDYSVDCDTEKHKKYVTTAYVSLFFVFGYPLCLFILIFSNKIRFRREKEQVNESRENLNNNTEIDGNEEIENNRQDEGNITTAEITSQSDTTPLLDNHTDDERLIIPDVTELDSEDNQALSRIGACIQTNESLDYEQSINSEEDENVELAACNNDVQDVQTNEASTQTNESIDYSKYPLYVQFFCENYKREYWYWDVVELCRKVLQTSLVVLFGSEDPLTLGATVAVSMVFITSHAYFKPMKDSFEQLLQMTSLVAIFLNLLCAEILLVPLTDPSGHRQAAMAVFVILLNMSVVLLAVGNSILILWRSVKQHGCSGVCSCQNCLHIASRILSSADYVSHHRPASNGNHPAPV
ncbi:uncharacterized protein [Amphiura filiformis]|uniref:uncharacterized protein n=1 Tax=Amphiura filiformis TaxID=82378 RepID=UPI003B21B998